MQVDPGGYVRLCRSLSFISQKLREVNETEQAERVERAIAFCGDSPSEFLGESLIALKKVAGGPATLSTSVRAFASALAAEIREGFDRIGGG